MSERIAILCFGNSLTAGYHSYGIDYHPYSWKLEERLKAAFPDHTIDIHVDGVPGDLVISPPGRFLSRLQQRCADTTYDWVIVLGATNDLGHGYQVAKIWPALQDAWKVALDTGAQLLALTVPECAAVNHSLNARRAELNSLILSHSGKGFHAFDLHKELPYHNTTDDVRAKIWDDGLHLKPAGYDLIGNLVADHLQKLLRETEP